MRYGDGGRIERRGGKSPGVPEGEGGGEAAGVREDVRGVDRARGVEDGGELSDEDVNEDLARERRKIWR